MGRQRDIQSVWPGDDIPIEGRITAVADVFDALSTRRSYKPAFPWKSASRSWKKAAELSLNLEFSTRFSPAAKRSCKFKFELRRSPIVPRRRDARRAPAAALSGRRICQ